MRYSLIILFLFSGIIIFAQGIDPVPPASVEVPIDGGVLGLLAAGAIYGFNKLRKHNKT